MAAEIRALTGIRGIGAALIVVYHFGKIQLDRVHDVWPIPHGYMAVDLFFMLSGFSATGTRLPSGRCKTTRPSSSGALRGCIRPISSSARCSY